MLGGCCRFKLIIQLKWFCIYCLPPRDKVDCNAAFQQNSFSTLKVTSSEQVSFCHFYQVLFQMSQPNKSRNIYIPSQNTESPQHVYGKCLNLHVNWFSHPGRKKSKSLKNLLACRNCTMAHSHMSAVSLKRPQSVSVGSNVRFLPLSEFYSWLACTACLRSIHTFNWNICYAPLGNTCKLSTVESVESVTLHMCTQCSNFICIWCDIHSYQAVGIFLAAPNAPELTVHSMQ